MKISKPLEKIINEQICHEFESSYIYLGMAAWFESTPFKGFAHWMKKQSSEELSHAMKFYHYLADRNGTIELSPIGKAKTHYESPVEAFKVSLKHEQKITKLLHGIYELAMKEKDYETIEFLGWFIKEQVEEEKSTGDFLEKLELADKNLSALFKLDSMASKRE